MNHKWKKTELPERLKDTFLAEWKCIRGECGCIKRSFRYPGGSIGYQYERSQHFTKTTPPCYGNIKLNDQTID